MKGMALVALVLIVGNVEVQAQTKVNADDLDGVWRLVVDLEEQGENAFERIVLNSVEGILDEIKVSFHFRRDHTLRITTYAFGEKDVEYSEWQINDEGELLIGDTDKLQQHDATVWRFDQGRLYAYDADNDFERGELYLERLN